MRANALAVFPGGFGTFDELFEILTLVQTRKANPVPIVLFGTAFWREVVNFQALVDHGMIAARDLELFDTVDEPEEGWASLVRRGLKAHTPPDQAPVHATEPVVAEPPPKPTRRRLRQGA
jgi:hypothetical protein